MYQYFLYLKIRNINPFQFFWQSMFPCVFGDYQSIFHFYFFRFQQENHLYYLSFSLSLSLFVKKISLKSNLSINFYKSKKAKPYNTCSFSWIQSHFQVQVIFCIVIAKLLSTLPNKCKKYYLKYLENTVVCTI